MRAFLVKMQELVAEFIKNAVLYAKKIYFR
jgi:hypothetical protein